MLFLRMGFSCSLIVYSPKDAKELNERVKVQPELRYAWLTALMWCFVRYSFSFECVLVCDFSVVSLKDRIEMLIREEAK